MTTSYDTLNALPECSFIAGSDQVFSFTCYESDGINLLTLTTVNWKLCPYGSFSIETLSKSGSVTGTGTFTITFSAAETLALKGKYIQQVLLTDNSGNTFRVQGTVIITPAISA